MMAKKQIQVFTAGCPVCRPVVDMVKEIAAPGSEVTIHTLGGAAEDLEGENLVARYGIRTVPAVVVDGELLSCCRNAGPTREDLLSSGIG